MRDQIVTYFQNKKLVTNCRTLSGFIYLKIIARITLDCGDCVEKASDIFYLAGDGKVMVIFPLPADGQQRAEDAAAASLLELLLLILNSAYRSVFLFLHYCFRLTEISVHREVSPALFQLWSCGLLSGRN